MAAVSLSLSELRELARGPLDHFQRLGVERRWEQERSELEDAYVRKSALVHPDRYVGQDASLTALAQQASTQLNMAYKILRDPAERAEYLVALGGIDLDKTGEGGAPMPDQHFLADVLERRDQLDELIEDGSATATDALYGFREELGLELAAMLSEAVQALGAGDTARAAATLVRRRYIHRMLERIDLAEGGRP